MNGLSQDDKEGAPSTQGRHPCINGCAPDGLFPFHGESYIDDGWGDRYEISRHYR
jgi:hypothetical protein